MKRNFFIYLMVGFTTTLVVMVVLSLTSFQQMNTMFRYSNQVEHTYDVMGQMKTLSDIMSEAESSVRGFVITKDSSYLGPLGVVKKEYPLIIKQLEELTADNSLQMNRLAMIRSTLQLRVSILESLPVLVQQGAGQDVILQRFAKGRDLMDSFKENLGIMEQEEARLLEERSRQKEKFQRLTPRLLRIVSAIVGVLFMASFIFLVRAILDRFRFQQELQEQLIVLKQSNDELTQLAFAASHDLQEPVRKIRTFVDRLQLRQKSRLDQEGQQILERVDAAAQKLQGMLEDISTYMNLLESTEQVREVSLHKIWMNVVKEMDPQIKDAGATVAVGALPDLEVYPTQVKLMFRALLDNALRYRNPDVPPIITVSSVEVKTEDVEVKGLSSLQRHYYAITIQDNGIGFDNEFKDKIFQLFRKLHVQEGLSGKGLGLAICQRIMANHNGKIDAFASTERGAAFTLYFPR